MESLLRLKLSDVEQTFSKIPAGKVPSIFKAKRHPRYKALLEEGEAWAEARIDPVLPEAVMEKLRLTNCVKLGCYLWPNAEGPRALTLIKFSYWIIVFDDVADDPLAMAGDTERLQRFCNHFLDAMFGGCDVHAISGFSEEELLAVELGKEWWGEMTRSGADTMAPPALQARIAEAVTAYVMAQLPMAHLRSEWEAWLRGEAWRGRGATLPCSLEELGKQWRVVSGAYLVLLLSEYDLSIEVEEERPAGALVQQLIDAVSDHIDWVNNILSFPKDMLKQETLNFVMLQHLSCGDTNESAVPFEVTLAEAWDVVARLERDCAELLARISSEPAATFAAKKYADALCTLTRSSLLWHLETGRYPHTNVTVDEELRL